MEKLKAKKNINKILFIHDKFRIILLSFNKGYL